MKKLQADTINGVYEVDVFEDVAEEIEQIDFYLELDRLEDGNFICATVDRSMFRRIDLEYGID